MVRTRSLRGKARAEDDVVQIPGGKAPRVGRHHQDEANEDAAAGAPTGGGAAVVARGGDEENTEHASCSSSSESQAPHEAEDNWPATHAGESSEDDGFTEDDG